MGGRRRTNEGTGSSRQEDACRKQQGVRNTGDLVQKSAELGKKA
jgi:hypothetical protein